MAVEDPRPEKVAVVNEVRERLSSSSAALLTEYRGLNVRDLATLRTAVRDAGGEYKIYKNTLVRLAVQDLDIAELEGLLTGPTAIAFVDGDAVMVAKSLREFARANPNLAIKGGLLGTTVLSEADASALADVAPREELLARLAGGLAAPLRQFAGLMAALPRNFAYGLKALLDQQGGAPPEAEAPPADASATDAAPAVDAAPAADAAPTEDAPAADAAPAPAADAASAPAADATTDAAPAADATTDAAPPADGAVPADDAPPADDAAPAPTDAGPAATPENDNDTGAAPSADASESKE